MKKQSKIEIPYSKYNTDEHKSLLSEEFTLYELDEAIKTLVNGKAAGIDDINTELLKQLGPNCRKWLLKNVSCLHQRKQHPKSVAYSKNYSHFKTWQEPPRTQKFSTNFFAMSHLQAPGTNDP